VNAYAAGILLTAIGVAGLIGSMSYFEKIVGLIVVVVGLENCVKLLFKSNVFNQKLARPSRELSLILKASPAPLKTFQYAFSLLVKSLILS
jgi:hypothetical protein